jgi:uncharacterized protein (TIGR00661 family)
MAKAFSVRSDVEVDYVFSGREPEKYFDMEIFGDYQTRSGLTFIGQNGTINRWQTVISARPVELFKDIAELDLSQYDLVLNDFEPITAWAAKKQKIPSISISHQAAFTHPIPKRGDSFFNRFLMKHFAPTDIRLGVHWYHFGYDIMPPFIEDQPSNQDNQAYFLVYLPFENLTDIKLMLEPLSEHNFICFHPDLEAGYDEGNIQWRTTSKQAFHECLLLAAGVIGNAGFELSSECLQLGKKLLLKPLNGQFEQLSNAETLKQLNLSTVMSSLDTDEVENWLDLPSSEAIQFPTDPSILIDWLVSGQWQDTRQICSQLWEQVIFPEKVQRKLNSMVSTSTGQRRRPQKKGTIAPL